jgi:hypothetical protein
MRFRDYKDERLDGIKWLAWGVTVLVVLSIGLGIIGFFGHVASTPARVISKTLDTDNVISNYEWFKRQYQDVQAQDRKLEAAANALQSFTDEAGPRKDWQFEDRQEFSRLNSVLLGLRSQRASMVAEYNARTQMANRDLFRTSDLPAEIQ